MKYSYLCSLAFITLLSVGCRSKQAKTFGSDITSSPEQINLGMQTFDKLCSSCHSFDQDGIGPNLSGLTRTVEKDWIRNFIRDPKKVIGERDPRAMELFKKYKVYMQAFPNLSDTEIENIISYLHTFEIDDVPLENTTLMAAIQNPIADTISSSGLLVELELIGLAPTSAKAAPLARINKMECGGKSGRLFINDLRGILYELKNGKFHPFLSLNAYMDQFIHQPGLATGFGSFAFHPDFDQNGLFYTTHAEPGSLEQCDFAYNKEFEITLQWVLTEWKLDAPNADIFSGFHRELMRVNFVTGVHGMQEIAFNPHAKKEDLDFGMLYIGVGDGGAIEKGFVEVADHQGKMVWGSILRIDPRGRNSDNGNYGIPVDNPFRENQGMAKEVWAYGFRNPNKLTWDNKGQLLATDIGQSNIEEVNSIKPGSFYGWPIREGTFSINPKGNLRNIYPLPDNDGGHTIEYPFIQYDHDESTAIIGGYVVQDNIFQGKYIFGDIVTGRLFCSDISGSSPIKIEEWNLSYNGKAVDLYELTGSSRVDLRFGKDCEGYIYILTKADGRVYRVVNRSSV